MHYRNDNQDINKDDIEPSNEKIDKDFYTEPSNYQYMNFGPMMYYPQSMPTYIEYDNNYNDEELNGYRLARARPLRRYRRHFHHHFFHHLTMVDLDKQINIWI